MVRYAAPLLSSKLTNVHEYGFFQSTTAQGNSSRIPPATKSPTCLFQVGASNVYNWNVYSCFQCLQLV